MKTKPRKARACCHPCLCCNESAMEILESAIQCETDRIGEAADYRDWPDALIYTRRLVEILEAITAHSKKGGRKR